MQIIKPLHLGVLHKSFTYLKKDIFCVSIPIAFSLVNGEILLEQKLWSTIAEEMDGEIFDVGMPKQNAEVLVNGNFYAPKRKPVQVGSVHLKVGCEDKKSIDKKLLVFPDRRWINLLDAGIGIRSDVEIIDMPIVYENAFGGDGYKYNPKGKGYKPLDAEQGNIHFLPNIEYQDKLITSPDSKPCPAGFSRIDMIWQPRLGKAGTYDEKYLAEQMPGFPNDIDWSYFNDAAEDQWLNGYFQGDEKFSISNMNTQHARLSGTLPAIYGRAFVNQTIPILDEQGNNTAETTVEFKEIKTKLDTLWLFPNEAMGVMIYRGTIEGHSDDGSDIKDLLLACENRNDKPRSLAHYQNQLTKRIDPEHGYKYALFSSPLIAEGMICGFKQIQEDYDFPLEMLAQANMNEFSDAKKAEAMSQVGDAKQQIIDQCKAAGIDPKPYIDKIDNLEKAPEQIKIEELLEKMAPGMLTDPENIEIFNIDLSVMDEIKAFMDELKEKKIAEAKAQINAEVEKLKALPDAHLFADAITQMETKVKEIELPPMWPRADIPEKISQIKQQVSEAKKQIDELRQQGVSEEQLPSLDVDIEDVETKLKAAEVSLKNTYLMGAHMLGEARSPHPEKEQILRDEFLTKFKNGTSLVDGDFACIDLSEQNLAGIDLSGCYLEGVNLSDCDLSNAKLEKAILAGANLTNAKLVNANFQGANIGAANLTDADFTDVNLAKSQLGGANFTRTKLIRCLMAEINFLDTEFNRTCFDGANMKQCNFVNPVFRNCSFVGADLTQVNFVKGEFVKANFSKAILDGANFVEAKANGTSFSQAQMINSRFVGGCDLNNTDFSGALVDKSCLRENQLNHANFSGTQLNETDLSGSSLHHANFSGAIGIRAQFMKSDLKNAKLTSLNLMEGSLYKAFLVGADFSGSNMYCVNFMDATLGENRYKDTNLDQTILQDWRP
jgi:uncharacterized protein YjbI with pentapeptide repeats